MRTQKIFAALFLCMFLAALLLMADDCYAAGNNKEIMQKKGVGGVFEGKGLDKDRTPSKLQMGLGIGSIFVAFAVVKWL